MTVAVVVTTYHRNRELRRALESALEQSTPPAEVVVVDGSGERHAEPIVEEFPSVDYLPQPENRGVAADRDRGVRGTGSEYVHFLDDDDRLAPAAIERKHDVADETGAGVVYSGLRWGNGHVVRPDPEVRGDVLERALAFAMAPCLPSTMLVRRDVLERVLPTAELPNDDGAMKIELARLTDFEYVEEPLAVRGNSEDSLGGTDRLVAERFEMLEHYDGMYSDVGGTARRDALVRAHLLAASTKFNRSTWSPRAIWNLLLVNYYARGLNPQYLGALACSLLGRPGWQLGRRIQQRMIMAGDHTGTIG